MKDLEIDECRGCRGVWFDEGEEQELFALRKVPSRFLKEGGTAGLRTIPEGERDCPRCHQRLQTKQVQGVSLDCCPDCKGFFADLGEIGRLAPE